MGDILITEAPDVEAIARELIRDYHPHLAEARIMYLRSSQEKKTRGKLVCADVRKLGVLDRYLSSGSFGSVDEGYDFIVTVYADTFGMLYGGQRIACIDHELCHIIVTKTDDVTGDETLGLVGHDVEEFAAVIQRHGLWNQDVRNFEAQARQMSLDGLMQDAERRTAEGLEFMEDARKARAARTAGVNTKDGMVDAIAESLDEQGIPYERGARLPSSAMRAARAMDADLKRAGLTATISTNIPGLAPVTIGARREGAE